MKIFTSVPSLLMRAFPWLIAICAAGCSSAPKTIDVSVIGVNYTDFEYSMRVYDPQDPSNRASSGELTPFSAGGEMCCYSLPTQWHPDLKIRVKSLKAIVENDKWIRDDITETEFSVPKYEASKLGTLWVLQLDDGKAEALNSHVGPTHPNWEGSVKGWPVPSLAYRTKIWRIHYNQALSSAKIFASAIEEAKRDPVKVARESWQHDKIYSYDETVGFDGPSDKKYQDSVLERYISSYEYTLKKIETLSKEQPK